MDNSLSSADCPKNNATESFLEIASKITVYVASCLEKKDKQSQY